MFRDFRLTVSDVRSNKFCIQRNLILNQESIPVYAYIKLLQVQDFRLQNAQKRREVLPLLVPFVEVHAAPLSAAAVSRRDHTQHRARTPRRGRAQVQAQEISRQENIRRGRVCRYLIAMSFGALIKPALIMPIHSCSEIA